MISNVSFITKNCGLNTGHNLHVCKLPMILLLKGKQKCVILHIIKFGS